jgi:quinone-modifying oxidoreductase subunit QmoC
MAVGERLPIVIGSDSAVVEEMLGLGADAFRRCYQCGTCSVVCPRTPLTEAFPRKEMVWAQWGLGDKLLADGDAWLCYQCNDCITHCPVDAKPGDVMAATRNLQIARYAFPRFMAKVISEPKYFPLAFAIPIAWVALMVLAAVILPNDGRFVFPEGEVLFAKFIPHKYIDVFTLSLLAMVFGLAGFGLRRFWAAINEAGPQAAERKPFIRSFREALVEVFSHKGFKACRTTHSRYFAHLGIFYGFLLLIAATTGAFIYTVVLPAVGISHRGGELSLPIQDPVKIIGNVGGILLFVAATQAIYVRMRHPEESGTSTYFDWFFVALVYVTTLSGFALMGLRFAAYSTYLVHLVFIFALFAYFPYSKFAHVLYRTLALTHAKQVGREAGV